MLTEAKDHSNAFVCLWPTRLNTPIISSSSEEITNALVLTEFMDFTMNVKFSNFSNFLLR